jgi:hypothetical protein
VPVEDFTTAVDRLLNLVGHWTQPRWSAVPAAAPGGSRGDVVHALVQRLADLAADAEGRPHRPVPRVGDLILPDQLRVMRDDLSTAATDEVLKLATDDVDAVRRAL